MWKHGVEWGETEAGETADTIGNFWVGGMVGYIDLRGDCKLEDSVIHYNHYSKNLGTI